MQVAFQLLNVSFSVRNQEIIKRTNLTVKKGAIYGFLGPNGAGKTTIMKLILNLLHPSEGTITVLDEEVNGTSHHYLGSVGSLIETPVFYSHLTVFENLKMHGAYMGMYDEGKLMEKLKSVRLEAAKNKKVQELSLGMKQRLAIARALVTEPDLLVLDEPINGLDPFGIQELRELLLQINREQGTTIFISSHIISEIESICDTIGFIHHGEIIKEMSMTEIEKESKQYIEIEVADVPQSLRVLDEELQLANFTVFDETKVRIYDPNITQQELLHVMILNGIEIKSVAEKSGNLEEYFIKLMSGGAKK